MSDTDVVLVEREGAVATVILNRPEKLNALTKEMWGRVGKVFRELDQDDSLRCIIFRGAGDEAVGPGADISEFATERNNANRRLSMVR